MKYKVECFRLDDMGRGITRIDDKITFVNNFLPGEIAVVKIVSSKKKYNEAEVLAFIKSSDDRVKPKCPYLKCGCHLKHMSYDNQLSYKKKKVADILYKFGGITPIIEDVLYDTDKHYRNKVTLKVQNKVGYYGNRSNKFIGVNECELVSDKINELISILNKQDLSDVSSITIKDFDSLMLIVTGNMDISSFEELVDVVYMNGQLVKGCSYVETSLNGLKFRVSKDSFFQVNRYLTEKLYETAIDYLEASSDEVVLDLYSGTGTISLLLSKYFKRVIGIEINEEAVLCANMNKKINAIDNVLFICGDASLEIANIKADKLIVDPPRSGLTKEGISDILKMNPKVMVYISCDPITLARDLKLLGVSYDVVSVTPVDMFPNTYHVENVVKLVRK
ncbi:MAG: class I SAM-dependent RNA methyltransferase [Bacilli bacterium]|nr:class I SAM-dependent RNA methyltransferase [Bacilli bacterium]